MLFFWLVRNLINMVTNNRLGGNNARTPGDTAPCNWRSSQVSDQNPPLP